MSTDASHNRERMGCQLKGADDPAQSSTLDELETADGAAYRRLISEAPPA